MQMFNGTGFKDKAFSETYETYNLALAIYAARKVNLELENRDEILKILLKLQDENGGFHTHYDENLNPSGDTNTETTSFALLALRILGYQ
jgi:prenyltransferase beta subunit